MRFLQGAAVDDTVEDTGQEGGVAYNLEKMVTVQSLHSDVGRLVGRTFTVEEAMSSPA